MEEEGEECSLLQDVLCRNVTETRSVDEAAVSYGESQDKGSPSFTSTKVQNVLELNNLAWWLRSIGSANSREITLLLASTSLFN